jgi:DNA-binding NarL/FixJ family response regulator
MNDTTRISVLFVDDDSDFLGKAKDCLTLHANMDVETALSGENALEKMKKKRTDVIVCDIQKPSTSGFELLKKLRESGDTTPFIVFTLTDNKELAIQAFQLGANGFIGRGDAPETVFKLLTACIQSAAKKLTTEH